MPDLMTLLPILHDWIISIIVEYQRYDELRARHAISRLRAVHTVNAIYIRAQRCTLCTTSAMPMMMNIFYTYI